MIHLTEDDLRGLFSTDNIAEELTPATVDWFKVKNIDNARKVLDELKSFIEEYFGNYASFSYNTNSDSVKMSFTLGNQFYYEEDFEDQYGDETETDCPFMTFLLKNYISSMRDMIRYIKDDSVKAVISYDNDAFVDTVE